MAHCARVASTLRVPASWVLLAETCGSAFLAPTAVLDLTKSFRLHSVLWAFVLHPGSTQTSGLMGHYCDALRAIELRHNQLRQQRADEAWRVQQAQLQDVADPAAAARATKRPKVSEMRMLFTSGSVEGLVQRMAEPQNLGRSAAYLVEGKVFLKWLFTASENKEGLIVQLADRKIWDKVTVKNETTATVDAPYVGIMAAVHMPELMEALGPDDPLGLRERFLVMYDHPVFARSNVILEACQAIEEDTLVEHIANSFWQLHLAHDPEHFPQAFKTFLNYPWRVYKLSEECAQLFWSNFDEKTGLQEEYYGIDQQAAKQAGKHKTKHARLAVPLHNLDQKARGVHPGRTPDSLSLGPSSRRCQWESRIRGRQAGVPGRRRPAVHRPPQHTGSGSGRDLRHRLRIG